MRIPHLVGSRAVACLTSRVSTTACFMSSDPRICVPPCQIPTCSSRALNSVYLELWELSWTSKLCLEGRNLQARCVAGCKSEGCSYTEFSFQLIGSEQYVFLT